MHRLLVKHTDRTKGNEDDYIYENTENTMDDSNCPSLPFHIYSNDFISMNDDVSVLEMCDYLFVPHMYMIHL